MRQKRIHALSREQPGHSEAPRSDVAREPAHAGEQAWGSYGDAQCSGISSVATGASLLRSTSVAPDGDCDGAELCEGTRWAGAGSWTTTVQLAVTRHYLSSVQ